MVRRFCQPLASLLTLALVLFGGQSAFAGDFHSARYGYTLEVPDGWVQIPDDVLQQAMRAMQSQQSKLTLIYDVGFQLDLADEWLQYPYVLVQPIPLPQQIDEDDFAEAVLTVTGMDMTKVVDENTSPEVRQRLGGLQAGQATLDRPRRRFLWEMTMDVQGVGPVRGLVAGHFGRESLIQVAFYSRAAEWDQYAKERQGIVDSFQFDPEKAYSAAAESRTAQAHIRQFLEGERNTFSSKGHPKAKGVHFTISYPQSWRASEAERPNIAQKFVSEGGRGLASMMIVVNDLPLPPGTVLTAEDQREIFSESEMRSMLPANATFIDAGATQIEGVPAGSIDYFMQSERAGIKVALRTWSLTFLGDSKLIQVQFSVGGPAASESELSQRMEQFKPLFTLMANSIVLPDKWTQATNAAPLTAPSATGLLPYDDPQLLIIMLVVSFIVTWILGLAPPLLTRYVFVRRPLSRKAATWIAAICSIFFWIAFRGLNASVGEQTGSGVVWIIVFFVARWIMSRGYKQGMNNGKPVPMHATEEVASAPTEVSRRAVPVAAPRVVAAAHAMPLSDPIGQARESAPAPKRCPKCGLMSPGHAERCDCGYDFSSRTMKQSYSATAQPPGPRGIGGWLILPAIGVVVSPLLVLAAIGQNMTFLDSPMMYNLDAEYPSFRSAIVGQTILSAAFFAFQLVVAVSFFMKKRFVPRLMITYLLANIALTIIAFAWTASIVGSYPEGVTEVIKAVVVGAVWIPYFGVSKRVKNTFV